MSAKKIILDNNQLLCQLTEKVIKVSGKEDNCRSKAQNRKYHYSCFEGKVLKTASFRGKRVYSGIYGIFHVGHVIISVLKQRYNT